MSDTKVLTPALHFGRLKPDGHSWNVWNADIAPETEKEQITAPTFWKHFAGTLRARDEIICLRDDMAWEATLRVVCVNQSEVLVIVTRFVSLATEDTPLDANAEYFVKWSGAAKFSVNRKTDGERIKAGFARREEASAFMKTLVKAA